MRIFFRTCVAAMIMATPAALANDVAGTSWQMADIPTVTVSFEVDRVSGSNGCNRFFGTVEYGKDGAIAIGPLASTKMACAGAAMQTERRVMSALSTATKIRVEGATLTLLDHADAALVSFSRNF